MATLWNEEDHTNTIARLTKLADTMHAQVFPRPNYCGPLPDYGTARMMLAIESQARTAIGALEALWKLDRPN